jgi:hypothetical protein
MSGDLYFTANKGIDSQYSDVGNSILGLGQTNANVIILGNNLSTTYINGTLNVEMANFNTANNVSVNNLDVDNKIITLNKNSVGSGTAKNAGILIRDNNIDDQGFFRVNQFGSGFIMKAPENEFIYTFPILTDNSRFLIDHGDQNVYGKLLFNNGIDSITNTDTLNIGA